MPVSVDKADRVLSLKTNVLCPVSLCDGALSLTISSGLGIGIQPFLGGSCSSEMPPTDLCVFCVCVCVCPEEYRTGGLKLELELELGCV